MMRSATFSVFLGCLWIGFFGCSDNPVTPEPDAAHLEPPPLGQGFQFETEDTMVAPGSEQQNCYFYKVSELAEKGGLDPQKPVFLHRIQMAQREGSHHMNIFRVKSTTGLDPTYGRVVKNENGVGECFNSANWADWPLIANSQIDGQIDWTYPDGVGLELNPDEWLMVQSHYVNAATQKTESTGLVRINFWTMPAETVTAQLGTIFATKQSIRVCQSNPKPTFDGTCQINSPEPVHIIGANGHFHSRGAAFEMYRWDGTSVAKPSLDERFYASDSWEDPVMARSPELDLQVPANGGVWYTCEYEWRQPPPSLGCSGLDAYDESHYKTNSENLDCCYTFGPVVDQNEHCNAFIYYYPKQDDVNCF